ncbi:MAG: hypothetical protein GY854_18930 [Deltaproteobacteria bacterium]|nr:hypothetical protein [Deltaproteobacteria bacterium]
MNQYRISACGLLLCGLLLSLHATAEEPSSLGRSEIIMNRCRDILNDEQLAVYGKVSSPKKIKFVFLYCEDKEIDARAEDSAPDAYIPPTGDEWYRFDRCEAMLDDTWKEEFFLTSHAERETWLSRHCTLAATVFKKCEPYLTDKEIAEFWTMPVEDGGMDYQTKWLRSYCNKEELSGRAPVKRERKTRSKKIVVVFPLSHPDTIVPREVEFLDNVVVSELEELPSSVFAVKSYSEKRATGCDEQCRKEAAEQLGGDYLVSGDVTPMKSGHGLSLRLLAVNPPGDVLLNESVATDGNLSALVGPLDEAMNMMREKLLPAKSTQPSTAVIESEKRKAVKQNKAMRQRGYRRKQSKVILEQRQEHERQRGVGGALIVVGVTCIAGSFGLGIAYGVSQEPALLGVGISLEVLGDILLITGIVKRVKGNRGLSKLDKARLNPVALEMRTVWRDDLVFELTSDRSEPPMGLSFFYTF